MSSQDIAHYNAILIEEIRSDLKAVVDHVLGVESRLSQRMEQYQTETRERFQIIESVLSHHTQMFQQNEERWQQNEKRWQQNEKRWEENERRWEKNEERWENNEESLTGIADRLAQVENKLDRVTYRVDQHEEALKLLQSH